jgi:hypothetical protein
MRPEYRDAASLLRTRVRKVRDAAIERTPALFSLALDPWHLRESCA